MSVANVGSAIAYEDFAQRSPSSFPVILPGEARPFWSKGWRGCEFNCCKAVDDWSMPMVPRIKVAHGTITVGMYCR